MANALPQNLEGLEVVRRLLSGGRDAWDRFAREYRLVVLKAVHTAARRFRAVEADVEDAANQVFVELLQDGGRALRAYRGDSALTTWLTVVAYRVAAREFARRVRVRVPDAPRSVPPAPVPEEDLLQRMTELPEMDRRALVLFHVHEASYREIAGRLGIPLNQVGMVLLRAREKLARLVGPDHP